MRLKKLILQGFKSFADRTEFVFDAPITGIVGPNGCGKSNVVDGFKWVLGEQSAKSLRGDGTSEYQINGRATRLKDIRELFLDTGVGVDAYSVIEQGRVAALLEANPEERRLIFEEAAGISKFKQRKKESQRKQAVEYELVQAKAGMQSAKQRQQYAEQQLRQMAEQIESFERDRAEVE